MAMLAGDYTRRLQSARVGASIGAGYLVDPVPISPSETGQEACPSGSVVTSISLNATSTAGMNVWFQDANGNKQGVYTGCLVARDYRNQFYCPWPLYVSCDQNVTVFCAPPAKGSPIPD